MPKTKLEKLKLILLILVISNFFGIISQAQAVEYYFSTSGNDSNICTQSQPCKSIAKVNSLPLIPGDKVLFKRGDVWRLSESPSRIDGSIIPVSGNDNGYITYGAYGIGDKPVLLGSIAKNNPADWTDAGNNIWTTTINVFDVGNIFFNNYTSWGWKKWEQNELTNQGDYYFDRAGGHTLYLYSITNPGIFYTSIECGQDKRIIYEENRHHIIYENLHLKGGAAHGIGGKDVHHIIVRGCDVSYVGGGYFSTNAGVNYRYGNGIEFFNNAHDIVVENCMVWEIYDAGITNQGNVDNSIQYNITYRNNVVWNTDFALEIWLKPETSMLHDISVVNNTLIKSGSNWNHNQREDSTMYGGKGTSIRAGWTPASTSNIIIQRNIFDTASGTLLWDNIDSRETGKVSMNRNCWHNNNPYIYIRSGEGSFPISEDEFETRKGETKFIITDTTIAEPIYIDEANHDYRQTISSPCYYMGANALVSDVDKNGYSNSTDAMLTLRNSLGLDMSSTNWQDSPTTGDVNCDNTTNSTDAMLILRKSLGLDMTGTGWCGN